MAQIRLQLLLVTCTFFGGLATSQSQSSTFLSQSSCQQAKDCYVIPRVLELACYYNVNKCNCQLTIRSIHRVESVNGACLMSKYGPCGGGSNSAGAGLSVGCLERFECIENQCRDPKVGEAAATRNVPPPPNTPYEFQRPCRDGCAFTPELRFECGPNSKCVCRPALKMDAPGPIWDVRNYDGDHNCSVGKFGPCGSRGGDGMQVDCHGAEAGTQLQCVNGRCIDAQNPIAAAGGACELHTDCEAGLICSGDHTCISRKSLGPNARCNSDEECSASLVCRFMTPNGSFAFGRRRVCGSRL